MSTRGSALVLVILALALLLSLGVPFLMSGKMRSEAARNGFARAEVRTAVDSASQLGLHHAGGSHPSLDPDPLWDAESEWNPKALGPLPMSLSPEWKDSKHVWGIEMSPVQGKISLATASPTLLQNLLHPCYITTDTDYRAVELPVTSTEGFAESGLLFIGGRWIQYAGKTASSFTGVVPALEEETPDDLASTRFWEGFVVLDPRVWNLAFARLQSGKHRPPEFFEDMLSQDITGSGPLAPEDVRLLERLTWLDTGRYGQADFGPAVWLTRLINPNSPDVLHVSDSSGFSMGTLARLEPEQGDPFEMYVMGTSVSGGRLRMSSPIPDDFEPFTTRVYPLMREPVDLNSASSEVLKALVAGLRWRNRPSMPLDQANPPSGNWRRDWVHPSQATRFAERVVRARPLKGPDDLWDRVLGPMAQDNHLSDYEAWAIFLNGLNADSGELRHTTAPFGYRTGDRYLQRVNASVRSRLGARLADQSARELVRAAPPGPALRMFPTQADYDDVARWARGAQGVLSLPWNLGSVGGLHQPRTQMGLRVGIWNPAGRVRPGGMDELTGLMPVPAREADSFGPNTSGKTEHFDWEVSPFGRDLGARGPWTSQLYEWGIIGSDAIYSTTEPVHVQGWFESQAASSGTLFDLAGPSTDSQRVWVGFEDGMLKMKAWDNAGEDPLDPEGYEEAITVQLDPALYPLGNRWLHAAVLLRGVSPRGVQLAVDGVPRGDINCFTTATTAVDGFAPGSQDDEILVESTEGFPNQGVLRIGNEVLEYSSKTAGSFITQRVPGAQGYLGGRVAREATDTLTGSQDSVHPVGAGVELYGYSAFLSTDIPPGGSTLSGDVGPFSLARGIEGEDTINALTIRGDTFELGQGISGDWLGDLLLAEFAPGDPYYLETFQKDGGYALLFQARTGWDDVDGYRQGGWEIVRYSARTDTAITILERNVQTPGMMRAPNGVYAARGNSFITEWSPNIYTQAGEALADLPQWNLFLMPLSVKGGGVSDALYLNPDDEHSEFVQLTTRGDSRLTEWVRYDSILNGCFLRDDFGAIMAAVGAYVFEAGLPVPIDPPGGPGGGGGGGGPGGGYRPSIQGPVSDFEFTRTLGEPIANRDAVIEAVREAFDFRGVLGTFDHAHTASAMLIPVFRTARTSGPWSGYVGRLDRVAVMQPAAAGQGIAPTWFTVEWGVGARPQDDRMWQNATYVAFQEPPGLPFLRTDPSTYDPSQGNFDPRMIARLSKFPSGERPLELQTLSLGDSVAGGDVFGGIVDEVSVHTVGGMGSPSAVWGRGSLVLDQDLHEDDEDQLRLNEYALQIGGARAFATTAGDFFGLLPESGILDIDGERIAYSSIDAGTGVFTISPNGRGLHGTEPRGHAAGTSVRIVDGRAATVLVNDLEPAGWLVSVDQDEGFPTRPLLLIGNELVHAPMRMFAGSGFVMPSRRDDPNTPTDEGGEGLLRGRFGTIPSAHSAGTLVYSMPTRWEDRWIPRSDSPANAWFQIGMNEPGAYWRGIRFAGELPDASHRIKVLARAGTAEWEDVPNETPGLRELDEGDGAQGLSRLDLMADQIDFRVVFDWEVGAFDSEFFLSTGWLTAPRLTEFLIDYLAEPRVDRRGEVRE